MNGLWCYSEHHCPFVLLICWGPGSRNDHTLTLSKCHQCKILKNFARGSTAHPNISSVVNDCPCIARTAQVRHNRSKCHYYYTSRWSPDFIFSWEDPSSWFLVTPCWDSTLYDQPGRIGRKDNCSKHISGSGK